MVPSTVCSDLYSHNINKQHHDCNLTTVTCVCVCVCVCVCTHSLTHTSSFQTDQLLLQPAAHRQDVYRNDVITSTCVHMSSTPSDTWIKPDCLRPVDGLLQGPGFGLILLQLSLHFVLFWSSGRSSVQQPALPQCLRLDVGRRHNQVRSVLLRY